MTNRLTPHGGTFLRVLTLAGSILVSGAHPAAAQGAAEVVLGAIVPSSGPFAEWGRANTVTLHMLEKQVNDSGGINGAKLRIVIYDDAARPAQATNSLRKLSGDDGALAVAGPLTSSAAEVAFPVANQQKVVATSQASSKPGVAKANRPWAFRNPIDEGILAKTTVPFFKSTFGIQVGRHHLRRQGRDRRDRRQQDHAGRAQGQRHRDR